MMKDTRTKLQKQFEEQTPTIRFMMPKKYLQTYCAWLEFQIEKNQREQLIAYDHYLFGIGDDKTIQPRLQVYLDKKGAKVTSPNPY